MAEDSSLSSVSYQPSNDPPPPPANQPPPPVLPMTVSPSVNYPADDAPPPGTTVPREHAEQQGGWRAGELARKLFREFSEGQREFSRDLLAAPDLFRNFGEGQRKLARDLLVSDFPKNEQGQQDDLAQEELADGQCHI